MFATAAFIRTRKIGRNEGEKMILFDCTEDLSCVEGGMQNSEAEEAEEE